MFRRRRKIIAIVALLLLFILLSLPLVVSRTLKTTVGGFFSPITKAVSAVGRKMGQVWIVTFHSNNIVAEKGRLEEQLNSLEAENAVLEEKLKGMEFLNEQFNLLEGAGFEIVPASVVGWEPDIWHSTVIINAGSRQGISLGDIATQGDKYVGRIVEVKAGWSRVRLLTDHRSAVPALVQKKRTKGIVVTTALNEIKMDYMNNLEGVEVGDIVITAEANHRYEDEKIVFPQGLVIGTVSTLDSEKEGWCSAAIKPAVDFGKLEKVSVIVVK